MLRFSAEANAVLDNGQWDDSYRTELKEYATAEWGGRRPRVTPRLSVKLRQWGLIEWDAGRGHDVRTALGKELSKLFS